MRAATKETLKTCIHCGTQFWPAAHRPDFCCNGCQFVHHLITSNGLGQFYDLQDSGVQPVKSLVFQKRDYTWLEEFVRAAEQSIPAKLQLDVQGISCIGCAWLIERLFDRKTGALSMQVEPTLGQLEMRWEAGGFDPIAFAQELQSFGYLLGSPGAKRSTGNRPLVIRMGMCAALTMNTMLFTLPGYLGMSRDFPFAALFSKLTLILGTLSLVVGGSYFFKRSWQSLRQRMLHIDLPISLGLIAAYAGSLYAWLRGVHDFVYFDFVSTFTFLMLVGRWLQEKAVECNRARLLESRSEPPPVHDPAGGSPIPVDQIRPGEVYSIKPGQMVPVRSRLASAAATFSLEWINGESETTVAPRGLIIPAGASHCGKGTVLLDPMEAWSESLLFQLIHIGPKTSHRDMALEQFIRTYLVVVIGIAVSGFVAWLSATGSPLAALQVFISVLVVSCPCASGVALPLCSDLAALRLRELGVFIRNLDIWSRLKSVRKIVFDKTGTLTLEALSLRNPGELSKLSPGEKAVLLGMVQNSLHPVGAGLREHLIASGIEPASTPDSEETIGFGLEITHCNAIWRLGRPVWAGGTLGDCVFSRNGQTLASFYFGETVRPDALQELETLQQRGFAISILSGDRTAKVRAMADRLKLPREHCIGGLSPQQKADWIHRHDLQDTLYLGDGANDSLAFDTAWCTGTPAVDRGLLEHKADFYFLGHGLNSVRHLIETATRRHRAARAVVAFAIAYNVIAIALCLSGKMNPLLAAVIMPASSLVSLGIVLGYFRR